MGTAHALNARVEEAVRRLARRYGLGGEALSRLVSLTAYVANDPRAPTTIREPLDIVDRHLADSLVALELDRLASSFAAVDLGSGAGFPGLPLALARPSASFVLLESNGRKCEFLRGAVRATAARNVEVVSARAEDWPGGRGRFDLATARAVGPLAVVIEYAAPLLKVGGALVAWRGRRDPDGERVAQRAAAIIGMEASELLEVTPFPGAQARHLHVISKVLETAPGFPRRPGVANKRPLGAEN